MVVTAYRILKLILTGTLCAYDEIEKVALELLSYSYVLSYNYVLREDPNPAEFLICIVHESCISTLIFTDAIGKYLKVCKINLIVDD